jgi:hypothetical protein
MRIRTDIIFSLHRLLVQSFAYDHFHFRITLLDSLLDLFSNSESTLPDSRSEIAFFKFMIGLLVARISLKQKDVLRLMAIY